MRMPTAFVSGLALCASACGSDSQAPAPAVIATPGADAGLVPEAGAGLPPEPPAAPRACSSDGWCWDGEGPHGNDLFAVAASGPDDVWAVGALGTALHFDGEHWRLAWAPERASLRALWVEGSEVWAVGDAGTVVRIVDGSPEPVSVPDLPEDADLRGVWGDSSGNRWLVGTGGLLMERRDGSWSRIESGVTTELGGVWSSADEVWVVGDAGTVLRRAEGAWARLESGTDQNLASVHGRGDQVWFAGAGGQVRYFDRDAQRWERPNGDGPAPSGELRSLQVGPNAQVYVATVNGTVHTWDGAATCPVPGDAGAPEQPCPSWGEVRASGLELPIHGLWVSGDDAIAVGPQGALIRWQGERRSVIGKGSLDNYLDISGAGSDELWVAGDRVLAKSAGDWREIVRDTPRAAYAVAALGAGRSLIAGTGGMARSYTGDVWEDMDVAANAWLRGLWSDGESGWMVGSRGQAWGLLNRRLWTPLPTSIDRDLLDVWSLPSGVTWAVGVQGVTLRHDGARWAAVPSGPDGGSSADLRGVWASAEDDVWAVGTNGAILRWDGTLWSPAAPEATYALNDVWGRSERDIWAVGSAGTVLHFDGESWQPEFSGTQHTLNAVWGRDGELWAAGEHGTILVKSLRAE